MKRFKYLAVAAMVALGACDEGGDLSPPEEITGSLTVNVSAEGENVDVTVAIAGPESRSEATGADGTVTFAGVEAGAYAVTINGIPSGFAFATTAQTATIDTDGETVTVSFSGSIVRTASIAGQVTAGGTGVAGVTIDIDGPEGTQSAQTGSGGNYSFTGLRGGSYDITMNALANDVAECAEATVTRQLPAGGSAVADFGCTDVSAGEATVSIQSITAGGAPINLNNVAGQIEVALNVDRAGNELDRAEVVIDGEVVASQSFAPAASGDEAGQAETVILNVPTAQLRSANGEDGPFVPVVYNGGATVSANLFVVGEAQPIPSNEVPVVMNNVDALLVEDVTFEPGSPENTAEGASVGGNTTWFAGSVIFDGANYISYAGPGFEPTAVRFADDNGTCGAPTSSLAGDAETGIVVTNTFACTLTEGPIGPDYANGTQTTILPTTVGPDGSVVVPPGNVSRLGAQFMLDGEQRWFLVPNNAGLVPPADINIDNLGPTIVVDGENDADRQPPSTDVNGVVAFMDAFDQWWVKADYDFSQDIMITDGGVGVDAAATQGMLWAGDDPVTGALEGSCSGAEIAVGGDLAETIASDGTPDGYLFCATGADLLANGGVSSASNYFGVDTGAPSVRIHGTTAATPAIAMTNPVSGPSVGLTPVSATPNNTIYDINGGVGPVPTSGPYDGTMTWGLEGLDSRSGFEQSGAVAGFPAAQTLTQTSVLGVDNSCVTEDMLGVILSDNWVRTASDLPFTCALSEPGYFAYSGQVIDRAGNASSELAFNWLVDQVAAPALTSVQFATTFYNPGQDATFVLFGQDDLEVIDAQLTVDYPVVGPSTLSVRSDFNVGTRWDGLPPNFDADAFTTGVIGLQVTVPNIIGRFDFTCAGAAAPYPSCADIDGDADAVDEIATVTADFNTVDGTDAGQLPGTVTATDMVDAGYNSYATEGGAPMSAAFLPAQWQTAEPAPWNDLDADLIAWRVIDNGSTLTAEHKASTSIEDPYFDSVLLVVNDGGTAVVCGAFPSGNPPVNPALTDNGFFRFWSYTITQPAAGTPCGDAIGNVGATWHAVGVKDAAALVTQGIPNV